jgi:hypothetical protein
MSNHVFTDRDRNAKLRTSPATITQDLGNGTAHATVMPDKGRPFTVTNARICAEPTEGCLSPVPAPAAEAAPKPTKTKTPKAA